MKVYVLAICLFAVVAAVLAVPAPDNESFEEFNDDRAVALEHGLRIRRETCDWYALTRDYPCMAHCVALGHLRGGRCVKKICRCIMT